jgi:hypothetical protein
MSGGVSRSDADAGRIEEIRMSIRYEDQRTIPRLDAWRFAANGRHGAFLAKFRPRWHAVPFLEMTILVICLVAVLALARSERCAAPEDSISAVPPDAARR